jgi:hypothetical protein
MVVLRDLTAAEIAAQNALRRQHNEHERDRLEFTVELCAALNAAAQTGQVYKVDPGERALIALRSTSTIPGHMDWDGLIRVDRYAGQIGRYTITYKVRPAYRGGMHKHPNAGRKEIAKIAAEATRDQREFQIAIENSYCSRKARTCATVGNSK